MSSPILTPCETSCDTAPAMSMETNILTLLWIQAMKVHFFDIQGYGRQEIFLFFFYLPPMAHVFANYHMCVSSIRKKLLNSDVSEQMKHPYPQVAEQHGLQAEQGTTYLQPPQSSLLFCIPSFSPGWSWKYTAQVNLASLQVLWKLNFCPIPWRRWALQSNSRECGGSRRVVSLMIGLQ